MNAKKTYFNSSSKFFELIILSILLLSTLLYSQTTTKVKLSPIAIANIQNGINSGNAGVMYSCAFWAGKYKISATSKDLLNAIKNSNCDSLCIMISWSLYEIGDESCCEELKKIIENHNSEKLQDFCKFLHQKHEYELAITKS